MGGSPAAAPASPQVSEAVVAELVPESPVGTQHIGEHAREPGGGWGQPAMGSPVAGADPSRQLHSHVPPNVAHSVPAVSPVPLPDPLLLASSPPHPVSARAAMASCPTNVPTPDLMEPCMETS